jgi:DNA repair exonuclease SbcCD nuclease subunit
LEDSLSLYRAILVADLHLSNSLPHSKPLAEGRGLTDRFVDQLNVLQQIWDYAQVHDVDVYMLGDMFDKKLLDAITLAHVMSKIYAHPNRLFILPGNHDANNLRGDRFMVEMFKATGIDDVYVLDKPTHLDVAPGIRFHFVPFGPIESNKATIESIDTSEKPSNYLFIHNSVLGAEQGEWTCDIGLDPVIFERFSYVYAGHFHRHQSFANGEYVGAPMQLNYGEEGHSAQAWLVEFTKTSTRKEQLKTESPAFRTFQGLNKTVGWHKGDYIRTIVEATHADWATQQPAIKGWVEHMEKIGTHPQYIHRPIYQHNQRVESEIGDTPSLVKMIGQYLDSFEVVLGDLDKDKLKALGHEALASVEGAQK